MAGRKPHSQGIVRQVLVLHTAGFAARRIARVLEISHTSVLQMIAGAHPKKHPANGLLAPGEWRTEPHRCPRCRQRIDVLPCRICSGAQAAPRSPAASRLQQGGRRKAEGGMDGRPAGVLRRPPGAPKCAVAHALGLELTSEQWQRLLGIRQRHDQAS